MSSPDSTTTARPAKPNAGFPLYAHRCGRWAKKIRGKTHLFGPWRDPERALRRYLLERDDLEAGRQRQQDNDDSTWRLAYATSRSNTSGGGKYQT